MSNQTRGSRLAIVLSGAALAVSIGWNGVPVLAAAIAPNSDKVDGIHAVHAGASVADRKGKLVATSGTTGRLPNNIIGKAPDSARLGGRPAHDFLTGTDAATTYLTQANAAASYLTVASAAAGYLGIADAASTYLSKTAAASTYLSKTSAASTYLSQTDAATTYWAKANTGALRGDYLLATDGRSSGAAFPTAVQSTAVISSTYHLARPGHLFAQMSETLLFRCATDQDYATEWLRIDDNTDHSIDVRSSAVATVSDPAAAAQWHTDTVSGVTDTVLPAGDHTVTMMIGCAGSNYAGLSWFLAPPSGFAVVVPNSFVTPSLAPVATSGHAGPVGHQHP